MYVFFWGRHYIFILFFKLNIISDLVTFYLLLLFFPDFVYQEFLLPDLRGTYLLVPFVHKSGYWTLWVLELVAVPTKLGGVAGWYAIMSFSVITPHPMSVFSYYHCMNPRYFLFKGGLADHGRLLLPKSNYAP